MQPSKGVGLHGFNCGRGKVNEYKQAPFSRYHVGHSEMFPDQWFQIIAATERKNGNPTFRHWNKRDRFNPEQTEFVENYWHAITEESERNHELYRALKQSKASKDRLRAAWSRVWLVQVTNWDNTNKRSVPTGAWRSGASERKSVSRGHYAEGRKVGGHDKEDTLRFNIGVIPATSKQRLFAIVADRLEASGFKADDRNGEDWQAYVERKFVRNWRSVSRNLFHHHGEGVWSTTHDECLQITDEDLDKVKTQARVEKSKAKGRTEHQERWHVMLATLPHCEPNRANPAECPRWKHVEADPARVAALQSIQNGEKVHESTKAMTLPVFLEYILRRPHSYIRDEAFLPYHRLGKHVQGKDWYPVELIRNAKRQTGSDLRTLCDESFHCEDFARLMNLAEKNGDIVLDRQGSIGEGMALVDARKQAEHAKKEADEQLRQDELRKQAEADEQNRIDKEVQERIASERVQKVKAAKLAANAELEQFKAERLDELQALRLMPLFQNRQDKHEWIAERLGCSPENAQPLHVIAFKMGHIVGKNVSDSSRLYHGADWQEAA
jgi:hypothetical protein